QTLTPNHRQDEQARPEETMKRKIGRGKSNLNTVLGDNKPRCPRQGRERAADDADDHRRAVDFFGRGHGHQDQGEKGDFGTADTLGSPAKSIFQSTTHTSPGWKSHGEAAQSHHYLRCYRLNS